MPSVLPDPHAPLLATPQVPLTDLFDAQVASGPERPCVHDEHRRWTYAEVEVRSQQLARWLRTAGIGPGDVVAIHAERNALTVWALLGVLRAGAAFMLLDADYPSGRLLEQVRIAEPKAWISTLESSTVDPELLPVIRALVCSVDLAHGAAVLGALDGDVARVTPEEVGLHAQLRAYVVFTSGTTGGPKAIEGAHAPLSHFFQWEAGALHIGPGDRFSALSGLAHDSFLRDVFTPLSSGASVHIPSQEVRLEPAGLTAWLAERRVTVMHLTPSLGEVLALARGQVLPELRWACFVGETLRGELVRTLQPLAPSARFLNYYGATETPQAIAWFEVDRPLTGSVPVGRGIEGVQLLVLDAEGAMTGIDEEGEICVRTPYLARYLDGEPRGFGFNPLTRDPDDRLYRTGDRGRYLADGSVLSLGRRDDQVKIRGFRIELEEVEQALRAEPGVLQATTKLRADGQSLVGYVVGDVQASELLVALRKRLPDYMVPSAVVRVESIPLTPNGKVDRRALPAPEAAAPPTDYVAPRTRTEEVLASIWQDLLGIPRVGIHDDFFALGGHSLLGTRCAAQMYERLGVSVPVRIVLEAPTVAELAAHTDRIASGPKRLPLERVRERTRAPLSYNQMLWWVRHHVQPESPRCNVAAAYRLKGPLDVAAFEASVDETVRRHDALRATFELVDGEPVQTIHPARSGVLEHFDLRGEPESAVMELMQLHRQRGYGTSIGMARYFLVRVADDEHRFLVTFHRVGLDPRHAGTFLVEVVATYAARLRGEACPFEEPAFQNVDFVSWQRKVTEAPEAQERIEAVRERLAAAKPLALPFDHPRPAKHTTRGRPAPLRLDDAFWRAVDELARAESTTQFVVLAAMYKCFLASMTEQDDILILAPNELARGQDAALTTTFGAFFNFFFLSTNLAGRPSLREVMRREHQVLLDAYKNVEVPAVLVMDQSNESPLWHAALNYVPTIESQLVEPPPGLTVDAVDLGPPHRMMDLAFVIFGKRGFLMTSVDKFEASTTERMGADFDIFLREALANPDAPFDDLYPRERRDRCA